MPEDPTAERSTLALSTKLEEEFISPLTAVRGALEILRDYPDLTEEERQRFVNRALDGCGRLEQGIEELATSVYRADRPEPSAPPGDASREQASPYRERMQVIESLDAIEVDLSDFEFSSSSIVNGFYDELDRMVEATGRSWYFIVNYRNCTVWPEAWVAFAHRGKKVNVSYSLGTVRYDERNGDSHLYDPDLFPTRALAVQHIEELRASAPH